MSTTKELLQPRTGFRPDQSQLGFESNHQVDTVTQRAQILVELGFFLNVQIGEKLAEARDIRPPESGRYWPIPQIETPIPLTVEELRNMFPSTRKTTDAFSQKSLLRYVDIEVQRESDLICSLHLRANKFGQVNRAILGIAFPKKSLLTEESQEKLTRINQLTQFFHPLNIWRKCNFINIVDLQAIPLEQLINSNDLRICDITEILQAMTNFPINSRNTYQRTLAGKYRTPNPDNIFYDYEYIELGDNSAHIFTCKYSSTFNYQLRFLANNSGELTSANFYPIQ